MKVGGDNLLKKAVVFSLIYSDFLSDVISLSERLNTVICETKRKLTK